MTAIETSIHAYFDAIRRKDTEAWVACFAPDAEVRDPADSPPRVGAQAHRAFFDGIVGRFDAIDIHPERIFAGGPGAAVYFRARCLTRDGTTVEVDGIDLMELDEAGRIRRMTAYWDPSPLLAAAQT